jgi:hypothetical protein
MPAMASNDIPLRIRQSIFLSRPYLDKRRTPMLSFRRTHLRLATCMEKAKVSVCCPALAS